MKIKSLGDQGLVASSIGLGCMGMSEFYGEAIEELLFLILQMFTGLLKTKFLLVKRLNLLEMKLHWQQNLESFAIRQIRNHGALMVNPNM